MAFQDPPTTFTLPAGATSGLRIVLDGTTGVIDFYDASNNLVAELSGLHIEVLSTRGNVVLAPGDEPRITFSHAADTGQTFDDGFVLVGEESGPDFTPFMFLQSLAVTGGNPAKIILQGDSKVPGTDGRIDLRGYTIHMTAETDLTEGVIVTPDPVNGGGAVDQFISGVKETWQAPVFQNSWTTGAAGTAKFRYRKVASPANCVQFMGQIHAPGVFNAQFMTLPVGYRPPNQQYMFCTRDTGAVFAVQVSSNGNCLISGVALTGIDLAINGFISLDIPSN